MPYQEPKLINLAGAGRAGARRLVCRKDEHRLDIIFRADFGRRFAVQCGKKICLRRPETGTYDVVGRIGPGLARRRTAAGLGAFPGGHADPVVQRELRGTEVAFDKDGGFREAVAFETIFRAGHLDQHGGLGANRTVLSSTSPIVLRASIQVHPRPLSSAAAAWCWHRYHEN